MGLSNDVAEKCDTACIRGFEILVYTSQYPALGRVLDYRIHYGASPIRDKQSMDAELARLNALGADYTVHPIM